MFVSNFNRLAFQFLETFDFTKAPPVTVIVGKEGLGKTTVLSKLSQKVIEGKSNQTILIDARKYASKYSYAAYSGELSSFRKFFRSSKLFLFDNINLLQGKKKTIEELFHTLDTIFSQGGKTVVTYCGDDFCFDFLGQRFASRLNSGLVIRLNEPTSQELASFADYYLSAIKHLDFPESFQLSKKKNLKQIIECIDRVLDDSSQAGLGGPKYENNSFDHKVRIVLPYICEYYGVEEKEVLGQSKSAQHVKARYMMYLLLHERFYYSYQEITRYFKKNLSGLQNKCSKMKEGEIESFETLCQKLYNHNQVL